MSFVVIQPNIYTDFINNEIPICDINIGNIYENNEKKGNLINKILGKINFSKNSSKSCNKSGYIYKEFKSYFNIFPNKIWVKTNKVRENKDLYASIILDEFEINSEIIYGTVDEYLGEVGDINADTDIIKYLCTKHWSRKIDKSIKTKKSIDEFEDNCNNRIDLTDYDIYSIDPQGCKDIDDALHYRYDEKMNIHEYGIHISDVSSFFDEDIILEMSNRIESIYLKDKTIHMFPENFSTNIGSLIECENRRAITILILINEEYNKYDIQIFRSLINVKKNYSYEEANIILKESNNIFSELDKFAKEEYNKYFITDYEDSHNLVELMMVKANIIIANKLKKENKQFLVRVQDKSNIVKKFKKQCFDRAMYKYVSDNNSHKGLNTDIYTTFTSPLRRYVDITNHQILCQIIDDKYYKINIRPEEIFKANYYRSHYKKCIIYENEYNLIKNIEDSYVILECEIIDINFEDNKIRVKNENFIFDIEPINKKFIKNFAIEFFDDQIEFIHELNSIKLFISQIIEVRVSYCPKELKKIKAEIKNPDFDIFFSL